MLTILKIWILVNMLVLAIIPVRAQEAPPTPQIQAMSNRIVAEMSANLSCNANVIDLQKQLTDAKAELVKLKPEPKKE